jgi:predicted nucleic acid-binding protein
VIPGASVYAEVMVRPLQTGSDATLDEFLDAIGADVRAVDRAVARRAAALRGRHRSLRLPEALSLASALASDADLLTLDAGLRRVARSEREQS